MWSGYCYERLDGSVRSEERYLAIKNFSEMDHEFVFLLSTRAGMEHFHYFNRLLSHCTGMQLRGNLDSQTKLMGERLDRQFVR